MKYYIIILSTLLSVRLFAERRMPPTPEEMHAKKWEYITQNAHLTPDEINAVRPIYMKYEEGIWELHKKNRPNRKRGETPNYEELNEKYIDREVKQAELLLNYHQELKKVLSPEVLFNYYRAERSHKRQLIHEMHNNYQKKAMEKPEE